MCNICLPLFPSNPIKSIRDVDIKDIGGHGLAAQITFSPDSHLMIKEAVQKVRHLFSYACSSTLYTGQLVTGSLGFKLAYL